MTWPAFKALARDRAVAVLPLGAIEAHGPHLPLGTDIFIAEAMARAGAERLAEHGFEAVILPALPVAPAPFAASFEGTLDTSADAATAVITGIFLAARLKAGTPTVGSDGGYDLESIAAVVLGGTALSGGRGGVIGTIGGVFILAVLDNVFNQLEFNSFLRDVVRGIIIIAAVAVYARRTEKKA